MTRPTLLLTLFFAITSSMLPARAELSVAEEMVENIKAKGSAYYYGEGYGASVADADAEALQNLIFGIQSTISSSVVWNQSTDEDQFDSKTVASSFATLANTEQIIVKDEPNAVVFRYVKRSDVQERIADREKKIKGFIHEGIQLEKKLQIASALRYFNWAFTLARIHPESIPLEIEGRQQVAKIWLQAHIETILNGIRIELDDVEQRPDELDPYLVTLNFTYGGYPVGDLDFSYNNGLKRVANMHATNGRSTLSFPRLPSKEIELQYEYKYDEEGKRFDEELAAYYNTQKAPIFRQANRRVSCTGAEAKKFRVQQQIVEPQEQKTAAASQLQAPEIVAEPRRQTKDISVMPESKSDQLVRKVRRVAEAISSGSYAGVRDCFTDEGYSLFMMMMGAVDEGSRKGSVIVTSQGELPVTIEQSGNYLIGKSIPVQLRYASGHRVDENIILRFDDESQIYSVAFALTRRAEEDIFRENLWELNERYAIKQFMEDYQTAFALKRLDYIEQIFSEDAVIIQGRRVRGSILKSRRTDDANSVSADREVFFYDERTKNEYMEYLRNDFKRKRFIQLKFEDNEIRAINGVYNNIFWIQLKQFYNSNSYSDVGYLALMIDMRKEEPKIKVRTWQPNKFDLNKLMNRYRQE